MREPLAPTQEYAITASYKWTRDEFVIAQQSRWRGRFWKPVLTLMGFHGLFAILTIFGTQAFSLLREATLLGTLSIILVRLWDVNLLQVQWDIGKYHERDVMCEFTPEALIIRDSLTSATLRWDALVRVTEVKQGFLFYSQPRLSHWVPLHAFESAADIQCARDMVVQSEVPFVRVNTPRALRAVPLHV